MRTKYLLTAAVLGGLVEFAWGTVSHVALVLPGTAARSFADSNAVVQLVRANAPENGIYFDGRGLFAAVAFRPDMSQKFESLARPLINQLLIEIGVAAVLAWVLLRLPGMTPLQTGILFAIIGVAAAIEELLPMQNWYGFPRSSSAAETIDLVVGWWLLGLVLGALRNRMAPAPAY
jgi:hypothetical protein